MEKLHFTPTAGSADPDERVLSDEDLQAEVEQGERR
jgi:hypothetical protein